MGKRDMKNKTPPSGAKSQSLVLRLNTRLFFRQLGIFLCMDLLLVVLAVTTHTFQIPCSHFFTGNFARSATINMNGGCIYYAAAIVMTAQIYGMNLTPSALVNIIISTVLVAMGYLYNAILKHYQPL